LDRGALAKAIRGGPYNQEEIQNLTPQQRLDYLQADGPPYYVKVNLQKNIEFREHNLLQNPFPEDMDLIVCRNVVIYFTNDAKEMLYQKFQRALRPGGVLFVGATEIIPRSQELGFHPFGISFYQKSNGCFQVPVSGFYERKPG
jgi:chemotaxis protein methyltransferase CheR